MALVPLHDNPSNGQRPLSVDHAHHQRLALPSHLTTIHRQEQYAMGYETSQQYFGVGHEADLGIDPLVLHPAGEPFDLAFPLGPVGHLAGDRGQIGSLAAHDTADECSKCM
jgi:hypothetical protein